MPVSSGSAQPARIEYAVDLAALEAVFEKYRGEKGALIPILQEAQDIYGYLPPQVQQRIAQRLGLSVSKVYGVATFYSQFYLERRGRHVLKLCDGTACHVKGAPLVLADSRWRANYGDRLLHGLVRPGASSSDRRRGGRSYPAGMASAAGQETDHSGLVGQRWRRPYPQHPAKDGRDGSIDDDRTGSKTNLCSGTVAAEDSR